MVISSMYQVAALELEFDPRPTPGNLVRFAAGTRMQYDPGGIAVNNGDSYSNLGYVLLGLVLVGLEGEIFPEILQSRRHRRRHASPSGRLCQELPVDP